MTYSNEQKRDNNYAKLAIIWNKSAKDLKKDNEFLSSRSYSALSNPVSAPYFRKLHRDNTPSKYYREFVTKSGIDSQCVSLVSGFLRALPYPGSGDLFLIPKNSIVLDYGDEHGNGAPAIYQKDAWTTRLHFRPDLIMSEKNTVAMSDFVGLRKLQYEHYMQKYGKNSLDQLINDLDIANNNTQKKGLKFHSTEINANIKGHMLLASFYRIGPPNKAGSLQDRQIDCLINRKLHELYGYGPLINTLPIVWIKENGIIMRCKDLENKSLQDLIYAKLAPLANQDNIFEQTLKDFLDRFFFTGVLGTESHKFTYNQSAWNYICLLLKYLQNKIPTCKNSINKALRSLQQSIEHEISKNSKKEIIRKNMQGVLMTLQLLNSAQDNWHFKSILEKVKFIFPTVHILSANAVRSKTTVDFKLTGMKFLYRLCFPVVGIENLFKEDGRKYFYAKMLLENEGINMFKDLGIMLTPPSTEYVQTMPVGGVCIYEYKKKQYFIFKHENHKVNYHNCNESTADLARQSHNKKLLQMITEIRLAKSGNSHLIIDKFVKLAALVCQDCPLTDLDVSLFSRPYVEISSDHGYSYHRVTDNDQTLLIMSSLKQELYQKIEFSEMEDAPLTMQEKFNLQKVKFALNYAIDLFYTNDQMEIKSQICVLGDQFACLKQDLIQEIQKSLHMAFSFNQVEKQYLEILLSLITDMKAQQESLLHDSKFIHINYVLGHLSESILISEHGDQINWFRDLNKKIQLLFSYQQSLHELKASLDIKKIDKNNLPMRENSCLPLFTSSRETYQRPCSEEAFDDVIEYNSSIICP